MKHQNKDTNHQQFTDAQNMPVQDLTMFGFDDPMPNLWPVPEPENLYVVQDNTSEEDFNFDTDFPEI